MMRQPACDCRRLSKRVVSDFLNNFQSSDWQSFSSMLRRSFSLLSWTRSSFGSLFCRSFGSLFRRDFGSLLRSFRSLIRRRTGPLAPAYLYSELPSRNNYTTSPQSVSEDPDYLPLVSPNTIHWIIFKLSSTRMLASPEHNHPNSWSSAPTNFWRLSISFDYLQIVTIPNASIKYPTDRSICKGLDVDSEHTYIELPNPEYLYSELSSPNDYTMSRQTVFEDLDVNTPTTYFGFQISCTN